jgi:hypothetical protein
MRTRVGCSWCHDWATVGAPPWPTCGGCGHRADVARMLCDCARCRPLRPIGFEGERFTFAPEPHERINGTRRTRETEKSK